MAQDEITKIIAAERKTLRHENAKKDYSISRLRDQIAALKETIKTQEDQLAALEGEGEGEDIQGDGYSYVSNDNDYEEDDDDLAFYPDEDGHEHLTAGMDDDARKCTRPLGTPRGRYDAHSGKFSLRKKPRLIEPGGAKKHVEG
ncbi:hypothetical protein QYE76_046186 [Lolium multiflorum]|uniref:Uncharacterized protein n=1 Tax=Lolium multiflorum TaxID=4521 RepID=A0AAD8X0V1_LOLMU|nr:hypothetical protein QYE76_046186 [Lolium multiflorum]